jgi:hypothetical protein
MVLNHSVEGRRIHAWLGSNILGLRLRVDEIGAVALIGTPC